MRRMAQAGDIYWTDSVTLEVYAVEGDWALVRPDNSGGEYGGGSVVIPVWFLGQTEPYPYGDPGRLELTEEDRTVALQRLRDLVPLASPSA